MERQAKRETVLQSPAMPRETANIITLRPTSVRQRPAPPNVVFGIIAAFCKAYVIGFVVTAVLIVGGIWALGAVYS